MRVHVLNVGSLRFAKGVVTARTWGQRLWPLVRGRRSSGPTDVIPMLSYVLEHDDGHIVIDTGIAQALAARCRTEADPVTRRFVEPTVEPDADVGSRMRAIGLRPEDVRLVLLTHLHIDHAGGAEHFPNAEVLVHRIEWDGRTAFGGNLWRLQEPYWTGVGGPRLYDLSPEPYGPFDASLPVTDHGDVVVLPTPGHTKGHVAIAVRTSDLTLLFTGDHFIRQSWYAADLTRGMQPPNLLARLTADTNRRLQQFVTEFPTLVLPTHDAEAADNLARWEPLGLVYGDPGSHATRAGSARRVGGP
jgi:N-acyl homoserine lactone hydrolase